MKIRKATPEDLKWFFPDDDDLAEAKAAGVNWMDNLKLAIETGCIVAVHNSTVLAFGGSMGDQCWFVTARELRDAPYPVKYGFRKAIMAHRDSMWESYSCLWNFVWVGNKNHYAFLNSIGAEFQPEFTTSPITGERFQLFTLIRR